MQLTMKESKFGAPEGLYRAKFLGVKERSSDQYGPGLEWNWEIIADVNGNTQHAGQVVSKTTAPDPTPKNSCGKTINGMAGRVVGMNEAVEITPWIGQVFMVVVELNATGNGTRVGTVQTLGLNAGSPAPTPAPTNTPPATGSPPPRRRPAPPTNTAVERFWVDDAINGVRRLERNELQSLVNVTTDPEEEIGVMDEAKTCGEWKSPSHFGFKPKGIPY